MVTPADVVDVLQDTCAGPTVLVDHSVGAMIGLLAELRAQRGFVVAHVMVSPSPCFRNDGDYRGGYEAKDVECLLTFVGLNFRQWSDNVARLIAGAAGSCELVFELAESFLPGRAQGGATVRAHDVHRQPA